jgi:hypothetical protein
MNFDAASSGLSDSATNLRLTEIRLLFAFVMPLKRGILLHLRMCYEVYFP